MSGLNFKELGVVVEKAVTEGAAASLETAGEKPAFVEGSGEARAAGAVASYGETREEQGWSAGRGGSGAAAGAANAGADSSGRRRGGC